MPAISSHFQRASQCLIPTKLGDPAKKLHRNRRVSTFPHSQTECRNDGSHFNQSSPPVIIEVGNVLNDIIESTAEILTCH